MQLVFGGRIVRVDQHRDRRSNEAFHALK
jgi:hypothetical protein